MNTSNERLIREIKEDPLSCGTDIRWLWTQEPISALQHPNCPTDLWWELAVDYPIEAQASLLYPLLTLESPERWEKLVQKYLAESKEVAVR